MRLIINNRSPDQHMNIIMLPTNPKAFHPEDFPVIKIKFNLILEMEEMEQHFFFNVDCPSLWIVCKYVQWNRILTNQNGEFNRMWYKS